MYIKARHYQWTEIIIDSDLPSNAKYLALYLATFMNGKQSMAWPSLARIEHETGLSHPTVLKYLKILEISEYIQKESGDRLTNNIYHSCLPEIIKNKAGVGKHVTHVGKHVTHKVGKHVTSNKQSLNKQVNSMNPEGFDKFWELYPKKVDKKKSINLWRKLNGEKKLIMEDLKTRQWNEDKQYIMAPSVYLKNSRWEDESILTSGKPSYLEGVK